MTMATVTCRCGHVGTVQPETLPRALTCSSCGSRRRLEVADCERIRNKVAFMEWMFGGQEEAR